MQKSAGSSKELSELKGNYAQLEATFSTLSQSWYPWIKSKAIADLATTKDKLNLVSEHLEFVKIQDSLIVIGNSADYAEAIKKAQDVLSAAKELHKNNPQSHYPVADIITTIENAIAFAYKEKYDFDLLQPYLTKSQYSLSDAEYAIAAIDGFMTKNQGSMMKSYLLSKRNVLVHVKLKLALAQDFKTINQLNSALSMARQYLQEISDSFLAQDGRLRIEQATSQTQAILGREITAATNELFAEMQRRAAAINSGRHGWCSSSEPSVVSERKNTVGNRIEFYREYSATAKGGGTGLLGCSTRFDVRLAVDGYISASESTGVSYAVTAGRLISEYEN
jgi:hypothetical protein